MMYNIEQEKEKALFAQETHRKGQTQNERSRKTHRSGQSKAHGVPQRVEPQEQRQSKGGAGEILEPYCGKGRKGKK